ncbi:bifunctional tetrahydrofolate synthase/dihydrofolate synthase [Paraglaciecola aestuariivivens]
MIELSSVPASVKEAWSLDQWLSYLEKIHPQNIELGLERVAKVYAKLALDLSSKTLITVAGTNGKGTTCALIEQALLSANQSVAVFSSPHILDYRERVRVAGQLLSEQAHCQAFMQVDQARADISLTYFEFGTLAALQLMASSDAQYLLLEVGLGGRLDAVNIVDPNIAVITSIDLDHQDWLGDSKEKIAKEKAGIFRANIPAVIGEPEPPASLIQAAKDYKVQAYWQGENFNYHLDQTGFHWQNSSYQFEHLPIPNIPAQNVSTALQVLSLLDLDFSQEQLIKVIQNTQLPGRRQVIQQQPTVMLDVAHNPQATGLLAADLMARTEKRIVAVVAMLADKDIAASLAPLMPIIKHWHCATLDVPRGAKAQSLESVLSQDKKVLCFDSVEHAYQLAIENAYEDDLIVVFGSFFTVAKVLALTSLKS